MSCYFSFKSILILSLTLFLSLFFPYYAQAALVVTFEETPLFLNADVLPGDSVTRTVTVGNTGAESEEIIFSLENTFSDGLADVMEMAVVSGSDVYADTTFTALFGWGEVDLGTLPAGDSKTYEFTSLLNPAVENQYQLSELGFDLLIGFSGGETITDAPPAATGGGGNGRNNNQDFSLFNEVVKVEDNSIASLTWDTNRSATSYAVCGNEAVGPFVLNPTDRLFGYVFSSIEDTTKVRSHAVDFIDLETGTYVCRVASREETSDEFTVSGELSFVITPGGLIAGITDSKPLVQGNVFQPSPGVAGVSTGGKGVHLTYAEYRAELDAMQAARDAAADEDTSSTTKPKPIAKSDASADTPGPVQAGTTYWMFILIGLVLLSIGWGLTKLRNRA